MAKLTQAINDNNGGVHALRLQKTLHEVHGEYHPTSGVGLEVAVETHQATEKNILLTGMYPSLLHSIGLALLSCPKGSL